MQRFLVGFSGGAMVLALPWRGDAELAGWLAAAGASMLVVPLLAGALLVGTGRHAGLSRHRRGPVRGWWSAIAGLSLGLVWSGLAHDAALDARLDASATMTVAARILDDPVVIGIGRDGLPARRFRARIVTQQHEGPMDAVNTRVRLSWYGAPDLRRGELWQLTAVLEGPWSYANPGGFDYERWLLAAGIQGTGYVRAGHRIEAASLQPVEVVRRTLIERVRELGLPHSGVLLAQLVGFTDDIPDALWDVFRVTGTVHLMVISGLHVSLAAALGFAIGRLAGRLCPLLPLWFDVRLSGCLVGGTVALVYVMLAGAGLPALRALFMSAATLALLARGRTSRLGSGLLLALAILLLLEPLAIHQPGFWLSFGAVALLYLCLGHRHGDGRLRALLSGQLAMSFGMLPLVAQSTGTWPWTSLPANLVAVPGTSVLVVPAVLLGGCLTQISMPAAGAVLWCADRVVSAVLWWLEWLSQAPLPLLIGSTLGLLAAQLAALCWLVGTDRNHRPVLLLCLVLPFAPVPAGVRHDDYRVMALDVGQGTAIVVDTQRHRLLYDAGPAFPSGFETGSAVVVPSLGATGPPHLDLVVSSHEDVDHSGGLDAVIAALEPATLLASVAVPPAASPLAGVSRELCHGRRWRWDGVEFHLLRVPRPAEAADNDRSCILLIDNGRYRTLIAGDISTRVEGPLLRQLAGAPVHLMFAPHHGSATSSSRALVRVLQPKLVFVNAGRDNRFGHPHPAVVERYRRIGAHLHQTGREGALIWRSDQPLRVTRWRVDRAAYWRAEDSGGGGSRR